MDAREELAALRRMAELEAKAGGQPAAEGSRPLPANAGMANFAATMAGLPVDTVQNVMNLGRAAVGTATAAAGRPDLSPQIQTGAVGSSEWIRGLLRRTGLPGLSPDNPNPASAGDTFQYDLVSRGGATPGGVLPAVGSIVAEKIGGPAWAPVGAMVPSAVQQAAGPAMQEAARARMQVALKPNLAEQRTGKAARAIETMLEGGFNPTKGGVEAMRSQIDDLNTQITVAIQGSPAVVNKLAVGSKISELLNKVKNQVTPSADIAAVKAAWQDFINHPLLQNSNFIPVQIAQELKQGTYQAIGGKAYGELKGADMEAQKALARGLKDEIAKAVPAVSNLNARESSLLNAAAMAERRAMLDGNRSALGLSPLANSGVGMAAYLADKSTLVNSLLAHGLNRASLGKTPTTLQALIDAQGRQSPRALQSILQGILAENQ